MSYLSRWEKKKDKKEILSHQANWDSKTQISVEPIGCTIFLKNKILLVPKAKQSTVYYEVKLLCRVLLKELAIRIKHQGCRAI